MRKNYRPLLRSLSALSVNLAAGWIGAAIITPNVMRVNGFENILILTLDIIYGIVFLIVSVLFEYSLEYDK